jgi:protein ImuB
MLPRQKALAASDSTERAGRCTALHDAVRQRLGADSIRHLAPIASHWPERSQASRRAPGEGDSWPATDNAPRPPLLLPRAEPADVIALLPDGPPLRIRWRGKSFAVAHAEGPERIAAEWWRAKTVPPTRDYYLVEDAAGRRLWLYREGLPGRETAAPHWFVHGLFA